MKNKDFSVEHNDEQTFLMAEKEPQITRVVLNWLNQSELAKWNHRLRRYIKRIPDVQGVEIE